jgi:group II intron reverse transcriptase/maturase
MRNATTILGIIQDRGRNGQPLEDVYRQLFNPNLYLRAYGRIYSNDGAMTRGTNEETVDGMSMAKINAIIEALRLEKWCWTPVRRVEIPKTNGKTRPLGIPTWSDKLLQEVMRSILDAYYEPQFSDLSHGFRPDRGCHTALDKIHHGWLGTTWFIEGDIKGCFDNIDHSMLLSILGENIKDNRFLRLVENLLRAGYMENWNYKPSLSGTPQGGIISPVLSNIYLDRLDQYVENILIPENTRGKERARNREYAKLSASEHYYRKTGRQEKATELRKVKLTMSSVDMLDPDFRRLRYVRYADDFILGFMGSKAEAETIKGKIKEYLATAMKLEMSEEKTLITHARTEKARFLGYEIAAQHSDQRRTVNGKIELRMPLTFLDDRAKRYMQGGGIIHRAERVNDDDFTIINHFQSEYRGYVQYYKLAVNLSWMSKLEWVMSTSLLKTLAHKHKTSVSKMAAKLKANIETADGQLRCFQLEIPRVGKTTLVARFGGISLKRVRWAVIHDLPIDRWVNKRSELITRLLQDKCELCGSTENIEVHHVRKLADVNPPGRKAKPTWMQVMSARRRKTLVLCSKCHDNIHAGRPVQMLMV